MSCDHFGNRSTKALPAKLPADESLPCYFKSVTFDFRSHWIVVFGVIPKMQMEDKFGRYRPNFLPIYQGQTFFRMLIEWLAMRRGSLICVVSLWRLCLPGAQFELGFLSVPD